MKETQLSGQTPDLARVNYEKLKALFPDIVTDGKIDGEKLKQLVGEYLDDSPERYNFSWNGKGQALRLSQSPSTGTLRPCVAESKNWDSTGNLYLEGDNLEVLKLLQKSYHSRVKMIYIDPPYNTGKDFVYPDNFKDSLENYKALTGQTDEAGRNLSSNPETSGRYHTDWLNMIYPRLRLARNLLRDDGVIFISIDDNEVENLKKVCNEVFGEDNFVAELPRVTKRGGKSTEIIAKNHDYLLVFKKSDKALFYPLEHNDEGFKYKDEYFEERGYYKLNQTLDYDSLQYSQSLDYPLEMNGEIFYAGTSKEQYMERQKGKHNRADWAWRWSKRKFAFGLENGFVVLKSSKNGKRIYTKTYQRATIDEIDNGYCVLLQERTKSMSTLETASNEYSNDNATKDIDNILDKKFFDYSKPISLVRLSAILTTKNDDIILDFFSGSATTAHAVMQLNAEDGGNRQFIMVQLPEPTDEKSEAAKAGYHTICDIGKERIRRAGEKIKEEKGLLAQNLDIGFKVFKLDSSNIRKWQPRADNLEQSLLDQIENLVPDRSDADAVYEIMLKYGLDLTWPVEELSIATKKVYSIGLGALIICMDNEITTAIAQGILDHLKTIKPETTRVVFRDNGFKTDSNKTNIKEMLKCGGVYEFITI